MADLPNDRFVPPTRIPQPDRSGNSAGSRPVSPALVWALCPRCGFRYRLSEMREEVYDERPTGRRVCPECWDKDDPHLQVTRIDLTDAGLVEDPLPHPQQQSVVYAAGMSPTQWDLPLEMVLGTFYLSIDGVDVTPPGPPVEV